MKFIVVAAAGLAALPDTMATLTIPKQYDHKDNFAQPRPQDPHLMHHKHVGEDLPGEQVADIIHKLQGTAKEILEIAENLQCGTEFRQCWIVSGAATSQLTG
jgi:hypothetical protein